jgi:protocatechuate 4,5-dioxygenase beta chain
VVVCFYNDHGLNFFLDNLPTFAVGAAPVYTSRDEGWGIPSMPSFKGEQALSWKIVETHVGADFDPATCQEMSVDHAFTIPMALLWPDQKWPVTVVPVDINTVQFPLPSARRCFELGAAVGRAIRGWDANKRVLLMGTGGLSHQLDGERAGFINKKFDLEFMDSMERDPRWATQYSIHELVELTGTQGVELVLWLAARAALGEKARTVHRNYHIPISNTASGLMLMEPVA